MTKPEMKGDIANNAIEMEDYENAINNCTPKKLNNQGEKDKFLATYNQ